MSKNSEVAVTATADGSARIAPEPAKSASDLATPAEHARALNQIQPRKRFVAFKGQERLYEAFTSFHNAASIMHGWGLYEHHAGKVFQLTRSAYLGAIEAVKHGDTPHAPAVAKLPVVLKPKASE